MVYHKFDYWQTVQSNHLHKTSIDIVPR
jgi:hypothetical protein